MKQLLPVLCLLSLPLLEIFGVATAQARSEAGFIDVHVHLIGGRGDHEDYGGATNKAIDHMDRFGIRKAIILPPPQVISQDWYDYPAFIHALSKYPDRFSFLGGGGMLNAKLHKYNDPSFVTKDVKRTFADQVK